MTLASAFAFLQCSQRVRPPSSFHKTLAQTYNDVPMTVLDQPLVDKIHTPSVNFFKVHGRMGYRHLTFPKHPLFADVFVPEAMPNPLTAGCSRLNSNLYQLLFTKRYGEAHS